MFYVGDALWMEGEESLVNIPGFQKFSGCARYPSGTKYWYEKGLRQSYQDPVTGEWLPAIVWTNGGKMWYDKGRIVNNPETYPWER